MSNDQLKDLCLKLMKSDSEDEIVKILEEYGYWQNPINWRYYGDKENNYSAAGNQADEAEAALVEKITNSRDAILMNECLVRGIDPKGDQAPIGVREAVAEFFEEDPKNEFAGQIKEWTKNKRLEVAKNMSVFITGHKPAKDRYPCINFSDKGEGQSPLRLPQTILSLGESIKKKIRFVHGKWNMGGTAALIYCGKRNLQLIISRRNPKLLEPAVLNILGHSRQTTDDNWGFTIVRREDPIGKDTSSTYKYLAPVGAEASPNSGEVLNFSSETMPIFAKYNEAYSVEAQWGTLIKLYEYETTYKQNVQGTGGLLRPLDLLAPDLGLPFRLHECRYEGKPGSFEHQINGLRVRLHDDRGNVLEPGYPTFHNAENIEGERISFSVYAFKDDKAKNYRDADKGCVFILNGQSQGWLDDRIFTRTKVGLGFIKNSLLVMVDCSELTYRGQEKLFVNDRVHIRKGTEFYNKIEAELIDYLANHQGLADLQEERKRKLSAEKLDDSKPLEAVLSSVFKHSNTLSKIFLRGEKLSNAFKPKNVQPEKREYIGKLYPTYFKFKKIGYGEVLYREVFMNSRCRIAFETDAQNDYFNRKSNKGIFKLLRYNEGNELIEVTEEDQSFSLNPLNGIANLNLDFNGQYKNGDVLRYVLQVTDPFRINDGPFTNEMALTMRPEVTTTGGNNGRRTDPPSDLPGKGREKEGGVKFPKVYKVYEKDWIDHQFDKYSAIRAVKSKAIENGKEVADFTFYINMDNLYLQHEIKSNVHSKRECEAYFEYGMALLGISIIYDDQEHSNGENQFENTEEKIQDFGRALSPILIPMIKEFGDFDLKDELLGQLAD